MYNDLFPRHTPIIPVEMWDKIYSALLSKLAELQDKGWKNGLTAEEFHYYQRVVHLMSDISDRSNYYEDFWDNYSYLNEGFIYYPYSCINESEE